FNDVNIQLDLEDNLECTSDSSRLNLILGNLLVNAIKYSDETKAEKDVRIHARSENGQLIIKVEDNGIGINRENLVHVREIFFRESTGRMGSGIGLFIVNEATSLLGGSMEIDSEK